MRFIIDMCVCVCVCVCERERWEGIWYQMIPCQRYQNPISERHVDKK